MFPKYYLVYLCAIFSVIGAAPTTTYAPIEQEHLTGWFNRDSPTGKGDFETLAELKKENPYLLCAFPFGIECQTATGRPYTEKNQVVKCNPQEGLICKNSDQKPGEVCLDYRVRFRCSHPIDECASNPCQNGATCRDRANAFECICPEGYKGERCEINIDDCSPGLCENGGVCFDAVATYLCLCPEGFKGRNCEEDINECFGNRCENGATCIDHVNGYVCKCVDGYEGLFCDQNIDDCSPQPCLNNGKCQDLLNGYKCWCKPGFTGPNCEIDIDECYPNPCLAGLCVDGVNSYSCDCNAGFRGDICQINEDDCKPDPCIQGTCIDVVNDYFCACHEGYEGKNCDINTDDCDYDSCMNGGTCVDGINTYTCKCVPGYTGPICEIDIDECVSEPCYNDGICINAINAYFCICPPGFTGLSCEINIDDCLGNPCKNGATCFDLIGDYRCECALGYEGKMCEISINECASYPCENGAACIDYVGYYECRCKPGFTGVNCEIDIDDCDPNPCLHGGFCIDKINGYKCICINGYTGQNCEVDIDECRSDPCKNGGTCDEKQNGGFTCNCVPGYRGETCEEDINECASNPCENGATCVDLQNKFWCNCVAGYEGKRCEQEIDECYSMPCKNGATCTDLVNSYKCTCYQGYEGPNCETSVNECDRIPCQNNGVCLNTGPGTYKCVCPTDWFGDNCEYYKDWFCEGKKDGLYSHWVLCSTYISCSNHITRFQECPESLVFDADAGYCNWPAAVPRCDGQQSSSCFGRPDGLYIDPSDCGQFIKCGGGIEYIQKCPTGLVFNEVNFKCDYPHNVPRCAVQQVDPFCVGKPDGNYKHPTDCNKYYICSYGSLSVATCVYNLVYNEVTERCDYPSHQSSCTQGQTGDVYCYGKSDGNYEYPGECNKFIQCSNGISTVAHCSNGLVYCIENNRCDYPPATGRCAHAGQSQDFCSTKSFFGLYRDPENCEKFYQCSNGNTYHRTCPLGLVYNEALEKCDYYVNVPECPSVEYNTFCMHKNDGTYPDPKNCGTYYVCRNGLTTHLSCQANYAFDEIQRTCTKESYLRCNGGEEPQYQLDPECPEPNGYFPNNNYCKGYFVCIHGAAWPHECADDLVFNPATKKCESVVNVPQCKPVDSLCSGRVDGVYPYPNSCTTYFKCRNGYSTSYKCKAGLAYNPLAKECQYPENTPSCFCVGKSDGNYADPTSCYRYYSCLNEVTMRPNCSPGLTYNVVIGTCDSSSYKGPSECPYQPQQEPHPLCRGIPDGYYGYNDKNRCHEYYQCSYGVLKTIACTNGKVYNPEIKTCSSKSEVVGLCGVDTDELCEGKDNGYYNHPTDCNKFYQCVDDRTYLKYCQYGLHFNVELVQCDYPYNVESCFNKVI